MCVSPDNSAWCWSVWMDWCRRGTRAASTASLSPSSPAAPWLITLRLRDEGWSHMLDSLCVNNTHTLVQTVTPHRRTNNRACRDPVETYHSAILKLLSHGWWNTFLTVLFFECMKQEETCRLCTCVGQFCMQVNIESIFFFNRQQSCPLDVNQTHSSVSAISPGFRVPSTFNNAAVTSRRVVSVGFITIRIGYVSLMKQGHKVIRQVLNSPNFCTTFWLELI